MPMCWCWTCTANITAASGRRLKYRRRRPASAFLAAEFPGTALGSDQPRRSSGRAGGNPLRRHHLRQEALFRRRSGPGKEPRARHLDRDGGSPTPFPLSDLISYIDEQLGSWNVLSHAGLSPPQVTHDRGQRTPVMSSCSAIPTWKTRWWIMSRLFRIPNDGAPAPSSNFPPCRRKSWMWWCCCWPAHFRPGGMEHGGLPVLRVCEEAHRYVPADDRKGFFPTRQALSAHRQGGSQIWHLAGAPHPAPVRVGHHHPVTVQHHPGHAPGDGKRPAGDALERA